MQPTILVIEDDILLSPDALSYFTTFAPLLKSDPSLFCVSGFHDNGFPQHADDLKKFMRTDFFSGLGWLVTRQVAAEALIWT